MEHEAAGLRARVRLTKDLPGFVSFKFSHWNSQFLSIAATHNIAYLGSRCRTT
jgi:hypothetical protein